MKKKLIEFSSFLRITVEDREDYQEKRSEKWLESERGEEYIELTESLAALLELTEEVIEKI